jgi:non-specific serine/threonine protein kinase
MRYVGAVCLHASDSAQNAPSAGILAPVSPPTEGELATLVLSAPIMPGAEYLNADVLLELWTDLATALAESLAASGHRPANGPRALNPAWNLIGRVHFNLAENRRDPDWPFAFMATYTTRLSALAKPQHAPLGQAFREYASAANRHQLLSLLVPVQRAAEHCSWLKAMVDSGEIFHPCAGAPPRPHSS